MRATVTYFTFIIAQSVDEGFLFFFSFPRIVKDFSTTLLSPIHVATVATLLLVSTKEQGQS